MEQTGEEKWTMDVLDIIPIIVVEDVSDQQGESPDTTRFAEVVDIILLKHSSQAKAPNESEK